MNKRKLLIFAGFSLLATANMLAANNEKGIDYFRAELYEAAKIFFLQQTNQSKSEKAENYYYLGHTYYQLNQNDSASYYYQKAIETFPEYPFGYIGEGKMELKKGNSKVAEELFKKANNFAKKDPAVQTTIAEVYVDAGDYNNAIIALERAKKVNSKYSGIYVVEGDMFMKQGKVGEACSRYDNALYFNKSDKVALLKSAKVYKNVNEKIALENLNKLIAIDPNYIPAYAVIGDIHYAVGRNQAALDAYEKFIAIQGVPMAQHESYAQLLYFTGQYDKADEKIKSILAIDPNNLVMKRIEAYNSFRRENFTLGLEQMNNFMKIMPEERHIYQDYTTLAQLAAKERQTQLALEAFQKAIDKDPERATGEKIYLQMAAAAQGARMFPEAVGFYEKYFENETSPGIQDFNSYGLICRSAAMYYIAPENIASVTTPEAEAAYEAALKEFVQKGDKAYATVIERNPDIYHGYFGRASIIALLDVYDGAKARKVEGYAKPLFEEALKIMLENNTDGVRNKEIITAYRYLVSIFYANNDMPSTIEYSKKILQVDPNDEGAKETLDQLLQYNRKLLQQDPNNEQAKNNLRLLNAR